ncbi:MAG: hypothetical protein Q7U92_03985 [Bradyrhizobium sp.]|nr:hypothetical protein [Bradyrhizobium sp.]
MAVTAEAISAAYTRDIVMVVPSRVALKIAISKNALRLRIVGETGKFPFKGNH